MKLIYVNETYDITILLKDSYYETKIVYAFNLSTNKILEENELKELERANLEVLRNYYYQEHYRPNLLK